MLTPDVAHKVVFTNVPIIGFKNDSFKYHLFRAVLPKVDVEGRSKPCVGKKRSFEVCKSKNDTSHFKRRETNETFNILTLFRVRDGGKPPTATSFSHVTSTKVEIGS